MSPVLANGDHVLVENLTYLGRKPRRGEVIVFKSDGIQSLPEHSFYEKRVVGEPGEHLKISAGKLYINNVLTVVSNNFGEIIYLPVKHFNTTNLNPDISIPDGQYFVIGDNTTNSFDSRFWGCLPAQNIIGRLCFCYWPPNRVGPVK